MNVSHCFNQAAHTYDNHATIQRCAGNFALDVCGTDLGEMVLDIGCGTGYCTAVLAKRCASVFALDLAPQMLSKTQLRAASNIYPVLADAKQLPFQNQSLPFVFSNFAMQWCHLPMVLQEVKRILKPQGTLVFTLPLCGSLREIAQAWQYLDTKPHINRFYSHHDIQAALDKADFRVSHAQHFVLQQQFSSPLQLLHSIKAIGASHVQQKKAPGLLGRQKFKRLLTAFDQQKNNEGSYPLSYHIGLYKAHATG